MKMEIRNFDTEADSIQRGARIPYGDLDLCARVLEEAYPAYEEYYKTGKTRMKAEDVYRLGIYLARIKLSHSRLRDTLKLFEALQEAQIKREKPIRVMIEQ